MTDLEIDNEYHKRNNRMDKQFKDNLKMEGFSNRKDTESLGEFYKPDVVLENIDTVVFFESSSTGDRKVHIGELTQFFIYINSGAEQKENVYFVLFLCGNSKTSPTVDTEYDRLRYYYKNFSMKNSEHDKIKGIYIANQSESDITKLTLDDIKRYKRIDQ